MSRTARTATVREIASEMEERGFMQGRARPRPGDAIGKPLRRRISAGGVTIGDRTARPTDPERWHLVSWYA